MIKTFKWIYKLGYDRGREQVLGILEDEKIFHMSQAEVKASREKDEKLMPDNDKFKRVSSKDHEQRRIAIDNALTRIDPKKYPNLDSLMDTLR